MILDETWQIIWLSHHYSCYCTFYFIFQTFSFVIRATFWKLYNMLYLYIICTRILSHVFFQFAPPKFMFLQLWNNEEISPSTNRWSTPRSRVARHVWEILTSQKPAMKRRNETWGEVPKGSGPPGMNMFSCGKGRFWVAIFFWQSYIYIWHNYFNWVT